jgi:ribosomal protein S18 acetylase RimI-like enzyme
MVKIKNQIEIVEYHAGLAAGVAKMWNLSRDGWGGDAHVTTEDKVRIQEENSSNLNLYLAMDGAEVVGYCSLCEYREDEGALYIPLLNVRSDYHGKKIGKQLVLKVLERSVELNWPRLDLYTWPGNTKAVPLYKKCGFFWEDRDDTTHLMNFMPTVLNTEAVKDFFNDVNWYEASTRLIEVSPDGLKENEFTYFEYKWEQNDQLLRMEFERTGRGLRLIETNDYLISVTVEDFKLVCNNEYKVSYYLKNKSGKPLHFELSGDQHKIVTNPLHSEVNVHDEMVIEAKFKLDHVEEDQSNWRTHPSVVTNVLINGKQAKFAVGILPKLPANISGVVPGSQCYLNEEATFYLDIENNFNEKASFLISFPVDNKVELNKLCYDVALSAKGKASLPIRYKLSNFGFYSPTLQVHVVRENGMTHTFTKKIGIGFKGLGAKFSGECDKYWHIYNGLYHSYLSKLDNDIVPGRLTKGTQKTIGLFPKLGKPYSSEFSKRRPSVVDYEGHSDCMTMHATYDSIDFPGIQLITISKLYAEGLLELSYKVRNNNEIPTQGSIFVNQPIYHELYKPVFVLNSKVIELDEMPSAEYGLWNSIDINENWLFSRYSPYAYGICWPKDVKVNFESWFMYVEHNLGVLAPWSERSTKPVVLSFGAYQSWEEFREFANRKKIGTDSTVKDLALIIDEKDKENVELSLIDQKTSFYQGAVQFTNKGQPQLFTLADQKKIATEMIRKEGKSLSKIEVEFELNGVKSSKKALIFNPTNDGVAVRAKQKEGMDILVASNGIISISASEQFYPALFSLCTNGKEWLDTTFPKLAPKSWWNPWSGGIRTGFHGINHKSFAKEKTHVGEAILVDQSGYEWKGLKIKSVFEQNEQYAGLGIEQYYLMLPGIPIVAYVSKLIQNTGTYFHYKKWFSECAFKPGNTVDQGWIKSSQDSNSYLAGKAEYRTELSDHVVIGSTIGEEVLQFIADRSSIAVGSYINKEILSLAIWRQSDLPSGGELMSPPSFFITNDWILSTDEVKQLQSITFK